VRPVQYTNTNPASLRADFKDQYRALIAAAYAANQDMVRARARLDLLNESDTPRLLAEQAQRTLAGAATNPSSVNEARALALLAAALGPAPASPEPVTPASESPAPRLTATSTITLTPPAVASPIPPTGTLTSTLASGTAPITRTLPVTTTTKEAPATPTRTPRPTRTRTSTPTQTPLPSRTPTPTPGAPFILQSQELVCDPQLDVPLLQIEVLDAAGQPIPGVEAIITWDGGEEHFFTGLKPEISPGYADFIMTTGVIYGLRLADGGQPVQKLQAQECEDRDGERLWASWRLTFTQP